MIRSLQIRNFRCFERLDVNGLATINIVVGQNGSGKTALLEAIFLAEAGNPEPVTRLRLWRGLGALLGITHARPSYESVWKDLFFNQEQDRVISISAHGTPESSRTLTISYEPPEKVEIPTSAAESASASGSQGMDSSSIIPITFLWEDSAGEKRKFRPMLQPTGIALDAMPMSALTAFYSSSFAVITNPSESASQFSELSKQKKGEEVGKTIASVFPDIKNLSVEINAGIPMLYCEVPGMKEKVPIALVSSGIHKLLVILLGMSSQPKGVVLVDEIENGVYYKSLSQAWKALLHFCEEFEVQLFASTHSMECLRAALPVLRRNENKFCLLRAERKDKRRVVRSFPGKEFEAAMEAETEVR
jgi:hypothetical protein